MQNYFYILFLLASVAFSQEKKRIFQSKQIKVEYHTKDGLLDGKYISYYSNGKKKAEGDYKNNLRVGKWNVWDSTGKVHAEHVFKVEKKERNPQGFFDYPVLKEKDVMIAKRVWRTIQRTENSLLFSDPAFFDILFDLIQADSLTVYRDDELSRARTKEDVQNMVGSNYYLIDSYKEKEDWFIDKKTNACQVRPLALYVILAPRSAAQGEKIELGWVYFPQLRKTLAAQKVNDKRYPFVKNMDDVFWYRLFTAQIYKETNVYDQPFSAYAKTPEAVAYEAERAEIDMIEMEHDAWLFGEKAFVIQAK